MDWYLSYMIFGKWAINEFVIDLHQHFVSDTVTFVGIFLKEGGVTFFKWKNKRYRTIF